MKAARLFESRTTGQVQANPANFPMMLIVDVDIERVALVTGHFKQAGFRALSVNNGEQGLVVAKKYMPDVILLDMNIPKLDGWAMLRSLRADDRFTFTPMLLIGGVSSDEDCIRGFQMGADDVLHKTWRVEELQYRVRKSIEAARMAKRNAVLEESSASKDARSFAGQLEDLRLTSLLSICLAERSTGVLMLVSEFGETGVLYIEKGELLSAKTIGIRNLRNDIAISHMIPWSRGTFKLTKMATTGVPKEITSPLESLLLRAATHVDEQQPAGLGMVLH